MHLHARHYRTGDWLDVVCDAGRIVEVSSRAFDPSKHGSTWIAPGLFDLQINGCLGRGFVSPELTIDDVRFIVDHCRHHGITGLCPTLITASLEDLVRGFTKLRTACERDVDLAGAMPAFHLEGPFISAEDGPRGAHPREHVRPPSLDEFHRCQEAAGGRIRLVTLSPEYDHSLAFIEALVRENVVVALGHTAASSKRIREAVSAGARLSTHLGNGSHAVLPRHDNYLWEQLAHDDLVASFIPDGHHLPAALLRCLLRIKTPKRLILTCDAGNLAGLPAGTYECWGTQLEVLDNGKIVVPGTEFLAGSGVLTDSCVRSLLELGELSLGDVLDVAGQNPRTLLILPRVSLEVGSPADLVLFEYPPFRLVQTICAGRSFSPTPPSSTPQHVRKP